MISLASKKKKISVEHWTWRTWSTDLGHGAFDSAQMTKTKTHMTKTVQHGTLTWRVKESPTANFLHTVSDIEVITSC